LDYPTAAQTAPRRRRRRSPWPNVVAWFLVLAFWGGLAYGGFYYTKQYVDRSLRSIQETNALQIQALEERLNALTAEMDAVEAALQDTGKTLSSSDTTRQALNEKIEALDTQLKNLEKSLNILKEAPNARR